MQYTSLEYDTAKVGKIIEKLREEKGVNVATFCEELGVSSRATYYSWVNGKTIPETYILYKMCNYFDVAMDYLLGAIPCKHNELLDIYKETGLSDTAVANIRRLRSIPRQKPLFGDSMSKNELDYLDDILSNGNLIELLTSIKKYRSMPNLDEDTRANMQAMISRMFLNIVDDRSKPRLHRK